MTDVFVSYKAEDRRRVLPLVEALEADGFSVWWDAQIGGGESWRESIQQHLDESKCVIVVWSKRSTGPEGRFVRDEASRAQRRGTYLPITIDNVEPPLGFGEVQALPLTGWKGSTSDSRYLAVSKCVHAILGREPPPAAVENARGRATRRALLVGGGVAVVAAAGGAWLLFRPAGATENTIAVLPFANLSGDPAQAYFSDGMAEELRSALAAIGGLQVVARTSSEMLREVDAITAARRLSVANVITGSVRRSPSTVRVSAQLVDGDNGMERWSQSFDRPLGDVLQIQSDIARAVAAALSVELGKDTRKATLGGTSNPAAQDLLLQATATQGDDSNEALLRRIALFKRATQLDPNYAEAHARKGLSQSQWAGTWASSAAEKDRVAADAERSIRRAIAIAPEMPLGHSALGVLYRHQMAVRQSMSPLRRATELPGADAIAFQNYAFSLCTARRQPEAEAMIERAIALDPLNPVAHLMKSLILFYGRHFERSLQAAHQVRAMAPANQRANALIAWNLLMLDRLDEAKRALQDVPPDNYRRLVAEGVIAGRSGRRNDGLRALRAIQLRLSDTGHYQEAEIYAQLGMKDEGIAALESAIAKRDAGAATIQVNPFLDPLRSDPRFGVIVQRVFA